MATLIYQQLPGDEPYMLAVRRERSRTLVGEKFQHQPMCASTYIMCSSLSINLSLHKNTRTLFRFTLEFIQRDRIEPSTSIDAHTDKLASQIASKSVAETTFN